MPTWIVTLLCPASAALLCILLLPLTVRLAPVIGAVDVPAEERRMHTRPIPRCGGIALFVAFWGILVATGIADTQLIPLLISTALMTGMGVPDDVFGLPAPLKLAIQLLAASIALWQMPMPVWLRAFSVLLLVLLTNAHNMIDGVDGLAAGVTAIEAFAAALLLLPFDLRAAGVAMTLLGVCLGYLPYNRHPARLFMGDEGALFLGFTMGWIVLRAGGLGAGKSVRFVPLLLCAVPLFDLIFVVIRRLLHGKNPLRADRGHLHHLLCDRGYDQLQICRILCSAAALFAVLALLLC